LRDPRNISKPLEPYGPTAFVSNNRAELTAVILALREPSLLKIPMRILTDSQYVIDGALGKSKPTANLDLWVKLLQLLEGRTILWQKVKGHDTVHGNICADALAVYGAKQAPPIVHRDNEDLPWEICISTLRRIFDIRQNEMEGNSHICLR
jgi:ribonuclease HI